jgi:hypothetical protein
VKEIRPRRHEQRKQNALFPGAWLTYSKRSGVLNNESVQVFLFRLNRHSDPNAFRFEESALSGKYTIRWAPRLVDLINHLLNPFRESGPIDPAWSPSVVSMN